MAVNVGMPRDVPWRGRTVYTGVFKQPMVSFARAGLVLSWNDERESLLELAEACDVPVRWSCRPGVCHTCELALLSGTVDYDPLPVEPLADGNFLICCSKPTEDVVLDA
ncbi:2Fe-2S iron-sulfur cluster-binding protein [Streptomyces seoulensis]|uniref:2Fe-2S iron-sulfur cluster-binding protein n=1 Tax=Streptomyces seoulensis TaxID=73044 RepID=UPI0033B57CFF